MKVFRPISLLVVLLLVLQAAVQSQPLEGDRSWYGNLPARITVENCSKQQIYVTIAERNQGAIDPQCSATYDVPYGEHKVIAEVWKLDLNISSWVRVSKFSPDGMWSVHDDDMR